MFFMKTTQLSLFLFVSMLFVSSFFTLSCKNKNTPSVSQPSVNPFDTSSLETQTLSAEDRTKLASAAGRTVQHQGIYRDIGGVEFSFAKPFVWPLGFAQ